MKMSTPDGTEMIKIKSIKYENRSLVLDVVVMQSMPSKVVLSARNFRAFRKYISINVFLGALAMLVPRRNDK